MVVYLDLVILLNIAVDGLLLAAAQHLSGIPSAWGRLAVAAVLGGVYGGACFAPGLQFLANGFWRMVSLACMGLIAYGFRKSALRQSLLFVMLSMALGGAILCLDTRGILGIIAGAGLILGLCALGFRYAPGSNQLVKVALEYQGRKADLVALHDTGNTLRDPVTGQSVLVINAQAANMLFGLTKEQLLSPAETILTSDIRGLRLIPYWSVGQPSGMLLAIRLQKVIIGKWKGSRLVAFAPSGLDGEGNYQALTGGTA